MSTLVSGQVRSRVALLFSLVAAALCGKPSGAAAQSSTEASLWATDGPVYAVAQAGDTLYLGGDFTRVSGFTGGGAALDSASAQPVEPFAKVEGTVYAAAPDGLGGWYVGGLFSRVGGKARANLAHVSPDGSVGLWDPSANGLVRALVVSGGNVYVGGTFTSVGGEARSCIAALDPSTGAATSWDPNAKNSGAPPGVFALAVSGSTVYAGGTFTEIGAQPRSCIAALAVSSGAATAWNPIAIGDVYALAVSGGTVYAGGAFLNIGGRARSRLAALNASTGGATLWNPSPDYAVWALAASGSSVYAGGSFTTIGGQLRPFLAELSATGAATSWNPSVVGTGFTPGVFALALSGGTLYAGGEFTGIGGQSRRCLAELDLSTALATSWDPHAVGPDAAAARALALGGSRVYAGGSFASVGGEVRNHLAALDRTTGAATPWDPDVNGIVRALLVDGSNVYVGGLFTSVGGVPRSRIAALDAQTGAPSSWDPNANGSVRALGISGGTVYVGGGFTSIGGQVRSHLAALDASGAATSWNPNASSTVRDLVLVGNTVYVGGAFTSVHQTQRGHLAAVDVTTGLPTAWHADADNTVFALTVSHGTLYAGGDFTLVGGQSCNRIAAIDVSSGAVAAWPASAGGTVYALAVSRGTVYAGGTFASAGAQSRSYLAAWDAASGEVTSWNPSASGGWSVPGVYALAADAGTLYVGGSFNGIGDAVQSGVAAVSARQHRSAEGPELHGPAPQAQLARVGPNPASQAVDVELSLPQAARVNVSVYDAAGRLIRVLGDGPRERGDHAFTWSGRDEQGNRVASGVYFVRFSDGFTSDTRKVILLR
ncbi:MAG: FlgD immunoglobulin-like domain containing protein [bacterium]